MFKNFKLDSTALELDPNLSGLAFDPGLHASAFERPVGQEIYQLLTSRFATVALIGALAAAPDRPPVVILEPLLYSEIGSDAFTDDMKKLTGRIVRYIVEHLGGRWVRRGVKANRNSEYRSGSTYNLALRPEL